MTEAHFVNHTHWDREWYFTTQDAQVLSDQLFSDVLKELEAHPAVNFTLDGQTSIVDEYCAMHPEAPARIRKLVARGQLFIGPWYTQTDAMIPDAESIIRNLVIGILDTRRKYGQPMMIGYLPDTFGFNAQLPMLLNQVGIHDFIFWRGTNFKRQMNSVYFKWQGLGDNRVYAANFPLGYYTGQIAVDSKKDLKSFVTNRLDQGIDFEAEHGDNDQVLIPSGIDQMNIVHNLEDTLAKVNSYSHNHVFISSYPEFMKTLRQRTDLPSYQGELRLPTYSRVHRTIGSVRSQFKRDNFKLEQLILKRVEPLMVIAQRCGIDMSTGVALKLWKKLLECQPHDTLGGSISDNVAEDVAHRFKEGFEIAEGLENYAKKRIAQRLDLTPHQVLVFNLTPRPFVGYKDVLILASSKQLKFDPQYKATIIASEKVAKREHIMQQTAKGFEFKDEPAYYKLTVRLWCEFAGLGYQVVPFSEDAAQALPEFKSATGATISNDTWQVTFKEGQFSATAAGKTYANVLSVLDSGNDGDTYDYSPLRGDSEKALPLTGEVTHQQVGETDRLILKGTWQLPKTLADRTAETPTLVAVPYVLTLSLKAGSPVLDGKLVVDNQAYDHRLRLQLRTGLATDTALAKIQGGFHETKNLPIDADWEKEFVEKPVNLYDFDKIVGMHDQAHGLFLLAKGMKEYELLDGSVAVTLMATTGQLGKPNLLWRPGRASGDTTSIGHVMTPTPLAEELGENTFEFGLTATGKVDELALAKTAERWLEPSVGYQLQTLNLFINRLDNKLWPLEFDDGLPEIKATETFLQLDPAVTISALYPAYTIDHAVVLRLANQGSKAIDATALLKAGWLSANALEEVSEDQTQLQIGAYDMVTLIRKG
ncbi:glycoside hydrolase family 38 C-terminal domain-containing protein [Lacticaseibacillus paracasei]|uniref:Glycoside hydrolase family 38 C-terminal domain-containing protein n=1 Tax=Lacticaseibacillus paracasei TaxID=1597 RepID=A0AAW6A880_LACPA|nr:glycoside hydrolase family 38 C-terminal domain-containing protein [Lacticaseibacillus paracasei]MDB1566069.1 glycoside hydrolase family 38 C-terminal domain-containing protein [Lacticaseibacillus paracasei]